MFRLPLFSLLMWISIQPSMVSAVDSFDLLMQDLDFLNQEISAGEEDVLWREEDQKRDSDPTLVIEERDQTSVLTNGEENPDDLYITIRVDNFPVILTDVPKEEWFAPYVRDVAGRGIVSGYRDADGFPLGLFGPADSVTIEQLAKMAVESAGISLELCKDPAKNPTAEGSWSLPYIACAEQKGWAVYSDGTVDVHRLATRAEVVVTILQAFTVKLDTKKGTVFNDVTTSTQFGGAIETAADDGIVSGYRTASGKATGEFGPEDPVNRAETAKIIALALQVYGSY